MTREEDKETSIKKPLVAIIIIMVVVSIVIILPSQVSTHSSMMVGGVELIDLSTLFKEESLNITYLLMSPTLFEPDRDGVYITEQTDLEFCYTCELKRLPVKVEYINTQAFNLMVSWGMIDKASFNGTSYLPIEKAIIHLSNSEELVFDFDKKIPKMLSKYSIKN